MARTRSAIKTLVRSHTGRAKDTLESSLCDSALKLALISHNFEDAKSTPADFTLTEDAWSVDISSASAFNIVTARIVEASGSRNTELIMKDRTWWDKTVVNPEDNPKGWPIHCLHDGNSIYFDRPLQSRLELRLRITTEQTFTDDSTECPIKVLDLFVEDYVTYGVFLDVGNQERAVWWKIKALGARYEAGDIGGSLRAAISADSRDTAEDVRADVRGARGGVNTGQSILCSDPDSERFGEVDTWYD